MKFYWVKTRWFIKKLFPGFVWDRPGTGQTAYLTFDDGPTPEVTEWVLDLLAEHNIRATFFCIGKNIQNHPEIFEKITGAGHVIGNHTFNHVNGWRTQDATYSENIGACDEVIAKFGISTKLFRPPYGKVKRKQADELRQRGFKLIMWDVLSADFDQTITPEKCLKNVIDNIRPGSIIIFHDSIKAESNLRYALPESIKYLKEKGYRFGTID